jgi:hypothetical protein
MSVCLGERRFRAWSATTAVWHGCPQPCCRGAYISNTVLAPARASAVLAGDDDRDSAGLSVLIDGNSRTCHIGDRTCPRSEP